MSSPHYETFNVYLAAFLRCKGAVLVNFERVGKRKVLYRFAADEQLHDLVRWYWSGQPAVIVPLALFGALRRLKSVVRRHPAATAGTMGVRHIQEAVIAVAEEPSPPPSEISHTHPCSPTTC